jgi:hypothetical protein
MRMKAGLSCSLGTGPSTFLGFWTEHYQGNIADSVRIDLIMWTGAPVVSAIHFLSLVKSMAKL